MIATVLPPHRPENFYDPADDDDSAAVARCLEDAIAVAAERGGHDVELSGTYLLASPRSTVVTPGARLTIYGRSAGAGFYSTNDAEAPFYLTGPTGAGARMAILEPAPVKSRHIRIAGASGIDPDRLLEIRQYLPVTEEPKIARCQQTLIAEIDGDVLTLDSGLDFPLDPALGECTAWPYDAASHLIIDTVAFHGAVAILQRFCHSTFTGITGQARFVYGYGNRFSRIRGQPSFAYQSAATIIDASARDHFLDFDGCSDVHADLLRSELLTVQQRNIKFAGCSNFRIARADIYGGDYTGLSISEGCYDFVVERADVHLSEWAVWTNGRCNERIRVNAFAGVGNPYDLNAADPLYFRRESGDGKLGYPAGSDVG